MVLAFLSIPLAWLTHALVGLTHQEWLWVIDLPSVLGYFGLLELATETVAWRWRWLHTVGLICVPDLGGHWQGTLKSSYGVELPVAVVIKQSWTRMKVSMTTATSQSESTAAMVHVEGEQPVLTYLYVNMPAPGAPPTMHAHKGTVTLVLEETAGGCVLSGDYYSGRDRRQHGTLRVGRPAM